MGNNKGEGSVIIHGLDLLDVVDYISTKNRKYLAMTLQEVEDILGTDYPDYPLIRKIILDGFNNYTRSLVRTLFGDIEDGNWKHN